MATVLGSPTVTHIQVQETSPIVPVVEGKTFPITITTEQQAKAIAFAQQNDITTIQQQNISIIGEQGDKALQKCLDGFLDRIEKSSSANIFKLVTAFNESVEKEDLNSLATRVLNSEPSGIDKFLGLFNKKSLAKGVEKAWNQTVSSVQGKTATLKTIIQKMELDTEIEQRKVYDEITVMQKLKQAYIEQYSSYLTDVAGAFMFLENSKSKVDGIAKAIDPNDQQSNFVLQELNSKLQALEARYIAMENTLTRIPAEQLAIAVLTDAAVKTLQESVGSSSSKFASIKSTLILLNGTIVVKGLQDSSQSTANLDKNLLATRALLMKQVVTAATETIGTARIEQANQIKDVIAQTAEMVADVRKAEQLNKERFIQARQSLAESRAQMLQLSQTVHV